MEDRDTEPQPQWRPALFRPPTEGEQPRPPQRATLHEGLTYAAIPGYRPLLMDVYVPEESSKAPCVMWMHGGAWLLGDRRLPPALWPQGELFQKLVDAGFAVATIDYRHAREAPFPAQLHDAKAAIRYLREFASTLHLDPDRIAVWGESAGAQLAMLTALSADRPESEGTIGVTGPRSSVAAVIDWYGRADAADPDEGAPLSMPEDDGRGGPPPRMPMDVLLAGSPLGEAAVIEASPHARVHSGAPPFFVMHGEDDRLIPIAQSEVLVDRLAAAGVEVTFRRVPGADHVFMGVDPLPLMDETITWLRGVLS